MAELPNVYSLADLLQQAGRSMTDKSLRKIVFVFHTELSYQVECMDARTNHVRYSYIENDRLKVQTYFDFNHIDVAMSAFMNDIKIQINRLISTGQDVVKKISVQLFFQNQKQPTVYMAQASGYRYEKIQS